MQTGDLLYAELAKNPDGLQQPLLDWWQEFDPIRWKFYCAEPGERQIPPEDLGLRMAGWCVNYSEYPLLRLYTHTSTDLLSRLLDLKPVFRKWPIVSIVPTDRCPVDLGILGHPKYCWIPESSRHNWEGLTSCIIPNEFDLHICHTRAYQPQFATLDETISALGKRIVEYGRKL